MSSVTFIHLFECQKRVASSADAIVPCVVACLMVRQVFELGCRWVTFSVTTACALCEVTLLLGGALVGGE